MSMEAFLSQVAISRGGKIREKRIKRVYVGETIVQDDIINRASNGSMETPNGTGEIRRNRNTNPRLAGSTAGWSTTGSGNTTMTATAAGAQIDMLAMFAAMPMIFQAADFAPVVGDRWSSSMEVTVPNGFPAAIVQLRNHAYGGAGLIVGQSAVITIQPGETVTVVAHSSSALLAGVTGVRTILYGINTPVGSRIIVRNALAEKAVFAGLYFDGTTPVVVGRNLALNPNAAVGGPTGFRANSIVIHNVARESVVGSSNPQGINSRAKSTLNVGQTSPFIMSMYDIDSLQNTGPAGSVGAWFYVNASGYEAWLGSVSTVQRTTIPANTWVWITGTTPAASYTGAYISKLSGNAGASDFGLINGVTLISGAVAPTQAIWGDYAPAGYASAWEGVANGSRSYQYDVDFAQSWTGTVDASESRILGTLIKNANASGGFVIRSSRWAKDGAYSVRLIPTSATASVAATFGGMPLDATQVVTSYLEAPLTGTIDVHAMTLRRINPITMDKRPNTPGEYQHRVSSIASSGTAVELWGARAGSGDIWYDFLLVVDGQTYTGPARNGRSPGWVWDGTVDDSTSRGWR